MLRLTFALLLAAGCATVSTPDDRQQLLRLHEKALAAHRASDVAILLEDEPDDYVIASRGKISTPDRAGRAAGLGPYLKSTRFESYEDLTTPTVKVSNDGTLGWVICQVRAKGLQDGQQLEFVSAWIELYEKRDGRWLRTGNVSNFAE